MRPDAPRGLFLARDGTWFHDGQGVHHERLAALLHRSIARRDDGVLVVTTGVDVVPFVAEDAPYLVRTVRVLEATLVLSDGSEEVLASPLHVDAAGRVRVRVKGGRFWALLSRSASQVVMSGLDEHGAHVRLASATIALVALESPRHGWGG